MTRLLLLFSFLSVASSLFAQSPSFQTYVNPVIPGDHPDPTLTKIGDYFYTSGSSFNPTPKIYRSTDLVHWEVIAQPVSASWPEYGDSPGGGIWGGHMVYYNDTYWHFFGRGGGGSMYVVTAEQPEGPWSDPTRVEVPAGMSGLGVDNSIFIDDDTGKWYLLTKHGRENNHIVELGDDGQPTGNVLDLTWLNPDSEGNPYSWAEGPVMWKRNGTYYYSFAQHLAGAQYVMRSETLTDNKSDWTIKEGSIFTGPRGNFRTPNHISPVIMIDDGTSWTFAQSYHNSNWQAQGRQGLLNQVTYDAEGFPVVQYPIESAVQAPALPGSGIPWMVPESDMFNGPELKPEWSLLGYTPDATWSLTRREGWLYLEPHMGSNTVIQNDGEHSYSLVTRVDFNPAASSDEAGLWIVNGTETHAAKVYNSVNNQGQNVVVFSFQTISYEAEYSGGRPVWLKLVRNEHTMSAFYSSDGFAWTRIGEPINASDLDIEQSQFNSFTGNQQGLYVEGRPAWFDLYIYRDAYTAIAAQNPANSFGVTPTTTTLQSINSGDWALYAGVEFGSDDYPKHPVSMELEAASASSGGMVEVWLDSIDTGRKIAELAIENTGSWSIYDLFTADVDSVRGRHDVYLRFSGSGSQELFRVNRFRFADEYDPPVTIDDGAGDKEIDSFNLDQNYPNPFIESTTISYDLPNNAHIKISIYDILGRLVDTLVDERKSPDRYNVEWHPANLSSGIYLCIMEAAGENGSDTFRSVRKLLLLK